MDTDTRHLCPFDVMGSQLMHDLNVPSQRDDPYLAVSLYHHPIYYYYCYQQENQGY
jgi:hypothetical protein